MMLESCNTAGISITQDVQP